MVLISTIERSHGSAVQYVETSLPPTPAHLMSSRLSVATSSRGTVGLEQIVGRQVVSAIDNQSPRPQCSLHQTTPGAHVPREPPGSHVQSQSTLAFQSRGA